VTGLKWTLDGLYVASCGLDNKVALHKVKEEKDAPEFKKLMRKIKDLIQIKDNKEEDTDCYSYKLESNNV